jgi:hypothetical protein
MRQKYLVLSIQTLVLLVYFVITTTIFFISLNLGSEGVTLRLFGGGDDGLFYWGEAKKIADGFGDVKLTSIFPLIVGFLIKISGSENAYIIRIFNYFGFILLTLSSSYLIKELLRFEINEVKDLYHNSKLLLLLCYLLYSSLLMSVNLSIVRDIWIYTLYSYLTLISIKVLFNSKNKITNILLLIPLMWLLGEFREYALLSFVLSIAIYYLYNKFRMKLSKFILFLLMLFGIYYTLFKGYQVPIVNMTLSDALSYRTSALANYSGGSQMWIHLNQPSFPLFLMNYLHSYIGNLLGPLPWQISSFNTLYVFFVETIPMIFILVFIWKKRGLLTDVQKYVLLHSVIWISLIALSNDNLGTATRLRPVAWILILIIFVTVYSKNKNIKERNIVDKWPLQE